MLCTNFQPATDDPVVLITAQGKAHQDNTIWRWQVVKRYDVYGLLSSEFHLVDKFRACTDAQVMANVLNDQPGRGNIVYRVEEI